MKRSKVESGTTEKKEVEKTITPEKTLTEADKKEKEKTIKKAVKKDKEDKN